MIRVFIADDHSLVREGLKSLLREEADMNVVGEAGDSVELLSLIRNMECDVLVLDITMPGKSGLEILQDLRTVAPKVQILFLTMHPEDRFAERAFKLGASGYVTKESVPRELIGAIRKVHAGGRHVSPSFAETLIEGIGPNRRGRSHEYLSDREFQILRLIASGKTVDEMARALYLSKGTVYTYRSRILEKMKMSNDAELTRYAVENRLID